MWTDPPSKIYRKFYLFDVKNPSEIIKGAKPFLVEKGPYTYSERWEKRHVQFVNENIVSFTPVVTLHFEPSLSVGSINDTITFLNVPAVVCCFVHIRKFLLSISKSF